MEVFAPIERALWVATSVAQALLLARLFSLRLARRYPLFCLYLAAEILASTILIRFDFHSMAYAHAFRVYALLSVILIFGVAVELFEKICRHFPGIGSFRFPLAAALSIFAMTVSLSYLGPSLGNRWSFPQTLGVFIQRYCNEALAFGFVLMWIFFRVVMCSRQPFRPNVLSHWKISTVYFAGLGIGNFLALFFGMGKNVHPVNTGMLALNLACQFAWLRSFRTSGEEMPFVPTLTALELQTIHERDSELLRTVTKLPGEISRRLEESQAVRARRSYQQ